MGNESMKLASDVFYGVLFFVSAWNVSVLIYYGDWVDSGVSALMFTLWTLWRFDERRGRAR